MVLNEQKYIDFGLALVNGCEDTYASTLTGIGPEVFQWVTNITAANDTTNPPPPADQEAFYEKAGFYVSHSPLELRVHSISPPVPRLPQILYLLENFLLLLE